MANRAAVHPDSPIQQEPVATRSQKSLLRDRPDAAQLQLARESFINALTSALEVASRNSDKDVSVSEAGTPTAACSGSSSPTSRTLSLQRSLSDGHSSGDESDAYGSPHGSTRGSARGSTHDSCISWKVPAAVKATSFVVVQSDSTPAQAEITPSPKRFAVLTISHPLLPHATGCAGSHLHDGCVFCRILYFRCRRCHWFCFMSLIMSRRWIQ